MDLGLRGKRALVTASTSGIGLAIAEVPRLGGCHLINGRTQGGWMRAEGGSRAKCKGAADLSTAEGSKTFREPVRHRHPK